MKSDTQQPFAAITMQKSVVAKLASSRITAIHEKRSASATRFEELRQEHIKRFRRTLWSCLFNKKLTDDQVWDQHTSDTCAWFNNVSDECRRTRTNSMFGYEEQLHACQRFLRLAEESGTDETMLISAEALQILSA